MNFIYGFLLLFGFAYVAPGVQSVCDINGIEINVPWIDTVRSCTDELKAQVKMEIGASMTYLAMGAYFSRDNVSRPGFSKFFMHAADEEREHATKLIEYMLMRGDLIKDLQELLPTSLMPPKMKWLSGAQALQEALAKEVEVTTNIRKVIDNCENPPRGKNDYHLVDYLTAEFLDEQYRGQRDLAGKYTTLQKMMSSYGSIAEFLFDKKLLNGEL